MHVSIGIGLIVYSRCGLHKTKGLLDLYYCCGTTNPGGMDFYLLEGGMFPRKCGDILLSDYSARLEFHFPTGSRTVLGSSSGFTCSVDQNLLQFCRRSRQLPILQLRPLATPL